MSLRPAMLPAISSTTRPPLEPGRGGTMPAGALPLDAYQEPLAEGDEGYWRSRSGGYFQEPTP